MPYGGEVRMNIPSIVIAGTNSGCGKTTVSMGIMAALIEKGMKVPLC